MDFLNWVAALHRRLGVDIPELDYPRLRSLDAVAEYLAPKLGLFRLVWVGGVGTRTPGPQVQTRFVGKQAASASRSPAPRSDATEGPASKTGDRGAAAWRRFLFLLPIFVGCRAGGTP